MTMFKLGLIGLLGLLPVAGQAQWVVDRRTDPISDVEIVALRATTADGQTVAATTMGGSGSDCCLLLVRLAPETLSTEWIRTSRKT
jgi:hypothetical protein